MSASPGQLRHKKIVLIRVVFILLCCLLALLQAWAYRFEYYMQDAVTYLDMADYFARGKVLEGMSSAWPPLYSAVIACLIKVIPSTPYWEILRLHAINCLILVCMLVAFEFFLGSFFVFYYKSMRHKAGLLKVDRAVLLSVLYAGFLWGIMCYGGVDRDTPDLLVSVFLCVAAAFVLRIRTGQQQLVNYVWLGVSLAFAYFAKGFAFTVAPFFLLMVLPAKPKLRDFKMAFCAALTMLLVSLPLIIEASNEEGKLTFSTAGPFNYLWYVRMELFLPHALGNEEARSHLIHPTRKIYSQPDVYEFDFGKPVTYPPHYDPAYWFRGVRVQFSPFRSLVNTIFCAVALTFMFFGEMGLAVLLLWVVARRKIFTLQSLLFNLPLFVLPMSIIGIHIAAVNCFINPHTGRYFGFSMVMLLAYIFASIRLPNEAKYRRAVNAGALFLIFVCAAFVVDRVLTDTHQLITQTKFPFADVAASLEAVGIESGDKVAQIGDAETEDWARLPRLTIIADIIDAQAFFQADATKRRLVTDLLKRKGVKAIVYFTEPAAGSSREMYDSFVDRSKKLELVFHQKVGKRSVYPVPPAEEGWQKVPGWGAYYLRL